MIIFFVFIFGTIVGSFLNVVILRMNTRESIVTGGSRCFSCGKKLKWQELIPVLSFVVQRGKCKGCGSRISWQYPIIEFITGIIFLLVFNFQFSIFITAYYFIIFSLLIIISVYDFRHQIIPNKLVYLFNILAFLNLFKNWEPALLSGKLEIGNFDTKSFLAGIALFAFFGALWLFSKGRWMGLGDAKLALGIPWLLDFCGGIWAFAFSFWVGALAGIILMILAKNRYSMKSKIPFGPFLALGALLAFSLNGIISCILV
jgi:leader peptidase (prepilin peptidase)/N-methyltransferase